MCEGNEFNYGIHGNDSACATMISKCFQEKGSGQFCIYKVVLLPAYLIGLVVGIVFGIMVLKNKNLTNSRGFYTISFFVFAAMCLAGAGLHCFLGDETDLPTGLEILRVVLIILDFTFVTNTSLTFMFAGLADMKIWLWSNKTFKILTIVIWLGVFIAWFVSLVSGLFLFPILYVYLDAVAYIVWFVTQMMLFGFSGVKTSKVAQVFLYLSIVFIAVGLTVIVPVVADFICKLIGYNMSAIISPMVILFYLYDLGVLFIGLFLIFSRKSRKEATEYFAENV